MLSFDEVSLLVAELVLLDVVSDDVSDWVFTYVAAPNSFSLAVDDATVFAATKSELSANCQFRYTAAPKATTKTARTNCRLENFISYPPILFIIYIHLFRHTYMT